MAKPMLPMMGVPMAQFAYDAVSAAGVSKVVANAHHLARETEAGLIAMQGDGPRIEISDERDLLLGSSGGFARLGPGSAGRFFL